MACEHCEVVEFLATTFNKYIVNSIFAMIYGCYILIGTIQNLWCYVITFLKFTKSMQQWPDSYFFLHV